MSETEPKYYTKSEVNRMLEAVEQQKWNMFKDYANMQRIIDDLKTENRELIERNRNLCRILVDTIKEK